MTARTVAHVIVTDNFAGAERYVATLAQATTELGWQAVVVGGRREPMTVELAGAARWLPGRTVREAFASLRAAGAVDLVHVHMTYAEAVAAFASPWHRAPIVATRHFAATRGSTTPGRVLSPLIRRRLAAEIAISEFVAGRLERPPTHVLPNGVRDRPSLWQEASRNVLVLQRLEREKDTALALRAWAASGLAEQGWRLRIVGDGAQREALEGESRRRRLSGVDLVGWVPDVSGELASAGMLLATAPAEPLGLSVLEAMAAGIPVVAVAAGGHLETAGSVPEAPGFAPGDAAAAGAVLAALATDPQRRRKLSQDGQAVQRQRFSLPGHARDVLAVYETVVARGSRFAARTGSAR